MTRTFTQSITGILSLIFLVFIAGRDGQAQTDNTDPHVICFGSIEPYQVDFSEGGGEGTPGSTYAWAVISGPFAGTLTPNQGPNGSSNRIVIDWGTSIAGNYELEVIETANGCPGAPIILNIQINPILLASQTITICDGQTATLPDGSTQTTAGDYTTTLPSLVTGCDSVITTTLIVNPLPTITVSGAIICEGETTTLTVSGADTYAWAPPAGLSATTGATVSASPTATITYTVTGTDANGCENTADATVTVNPLPNTSPIFHN